MTDTPERPPLEERVEEWLETLRVRWFMLDAQAKQALVLAAVYAAYTLFDIVGALVKRRIGGGSRDDSE